MKKNLLVDVLGMAMILTALITLLAVIKVENHSEEHRVIEYSNEIEETQGYDSVVTYNTRIENFGGADRMVFDYVGSDESGNLTYGTFYSEALK